MFVELPLSMFVSDSSDLIERLEYVPPQVDFTQKETLENDYERYINLEPPKNYNPTRVDKPSSFLDEELEPIFGDKLICFFDKYYILYTEIKDYITEKIEENGIFEYNDDHKIDNVDNVKSFLVDIVVKTPCTLYDVADTIGLNEIK
jgi:hypothetical protein